MNIFGVIKNMDIEELAKFLQKVFDDEGGSKSVTVGCYDCINYNTHHYPEDCGNCLWLPIENDYKKWLEMDFQTFIKELED